MHSSRDWGIIQSDSPNGRYTGDYDGEIYKIYWKWMANEKAPGTNYVGYWKWIGPAFGY